MTLEPCPFCGYDVINRYDVGGGYSECDRCTASGPTHDPTSEKWNAVSRAAHGTIPATIETSEVGPMPWRLQVASMLYGAVLNPNAYAIATHWTPELLAELAITRADALIARHKATGAK